jgi:hypothetical protein
MSQVRISQLQSVTNVYNTDFIPIVNDGVTRKASISNLAAVLSSSNGGSVFSPSSAVIIDVNTSNPALRVTQRGTGDALVVEDSTNPDLTSFIITSAGDVCVGAYGGLPDLWINNIPSKFQIVSTNQPGITLYHYGNLIDGQGLTVRKANGTTPAPLALQANQRIGYFVAQGYGDDTFGDRGTGALEFYSAENFTNTTKGTFFRISTTANGLSSRDERMRITDDGKVGIGTTSPNELLTVAGNISASGAIKVGSIVTGDSSGVSDFYVSANGNIGIGTESPNEKLTLVGNISAVSPRIVFTNLPTVSAGLPTGALYNSNGFLRIV